MEQERIRAFKETPTTERVEHLRNAEPILTSVHDMYRLSDSLSKELDAAVEKAFILDFYDRRKQNAERGVLSAGEESYAISPIMEESIFSSRYRNCQGLVVAGIDHEGKHWAFQTHHYTAILGRNEDYASFEADLRGRLREMISKCTIGTLDAVMFGGDAFTTRGDGSAFLDLTRRDEYQILAELTAKIVEEELDIKPRIVEGQRVQPSFPDDGESEGQQIGLYHTQERHLQILIRGATTNSGEGLDIDKLDEELNKLQDVEHAARAESDKAWSDPKYSKEFP